MSYVKPTPGLTAAEVVIQFTRRSDAELSHSDIRWLTRNIEESIDGSISTLRAENEQLKMLLNEDTVEAHYRRGHNMPTYAELSAENERLRAQIAKTEDDCK